MAMRRDLEHQAQRAVFTWIDLQSGKYPELALAFAIPNGGNRNIITASKLKAEGVKSGVPDIFLPVPKGVFHGLFIEMKIKPNRVSKEQTGWIRQLIDNGYRVEVAYGFEEAVAVFMAYLNEK
jgi:hypothetical protein